MLEDLLLSDERLILRANTTTTTNSAIWIGSISWKASSKINITLFDSMVTDTSIDADVLGFVNAPFMSLWDHADFYHPGLMDVIVYILQSMGEPMDKIEKMHWMPPEFIDFFCSYFLARPIPMNAYLQWLAKVMHFIKTDRKAQNMIWKDSSYDGDIDPAWAIYRLPFYPMHAFVGERLVQYFFNSRGLQNNDC